MKTQDEIRKRLIRFLNESGIKSKYICEQITKMGSKLREDQLSRFKNGLKNLDEDTVNKLNYWLINRGY